MRISSLRILSIIFHDGLPNFEQYSHEILGLYFERKCFENNCIFRIFERKNLFRFFFFVSKIFFFRIKYFETKFFFRNSPFESNFGKRGFRNDFSKKNYNLKISKQNILIFDHLEFSPGNRYITLIFTIFILTFLFIFINLIFFSLRIARLNSMNFTEFKKDILPTSGHCPKYNEFYTRLRQHVNFCISESEFLDFLPSTQFETFVNKLIS